MVQRSGDQLIVRSVVSGNQLYPTNTHIEEEDDDNSKSPLDDDYESALPDDDDGKPLPECKIKRNYNCNTCSAFFTQNPRKYLAHLRDVHGEKIIINSCKTCLYASRHYQKLVRHMKMVHGSTDGLEEQAQSRKRASQMARELSKRQRKETLVSNVAMNVNHQLNISPFQQSAMMAKEMHATASTPSPGSVMDDSGTNKLLKCSACEFTTLYRAELSDHERDQHTKTKFFRCEKCTYVTHIKARFSKHVKYHSMPMIKCNMCDFRTPYKWNLDRHMKNHGGQGPFKCAACNFTADIKQSLTVHEMNHHVPPVGNASGMAGVKMRRNKVGATDMLDDEDYSDHYYHNNNNNIDDDHLMMTLDEDDIKTEENESLDMQPVHSKPKKAARPIPNLIPIQPKSTTPMDIHRNNGSVEADSEQLQRNTEFLTALASIMQMGNINPVLNPQLSPTNTLISSGSSSSPRRRATNGADILNAMKEKMGENVNSLICLTCGHVGKSVSDALRHQRQCRQEFEMDQIDEIEDDERNISPINLSMASSSGHSNASTMSLRCKFCRHRCKSSSDLMSHLKHCDEAMVQEEYEDSKSFNDNENDSSDVKHPMENVTFIWNQIPGAQQQPEKEQHQETSQANPDEENGAMNLTSKENVKKSSGSGASSSTTPYYGIETAPGYGEVTKKMISGEEANHSQLRKVFKCPHCSFWASTASRFHVHIVGHLNKKPFECSLCNYRSNWRWDITKHIRLKTIRDPGHKDAGVLMNDETGRRNYTKYNKYITLMKMTDEDGDPKLLKSGEMTPSQAIAAEAYRNEHQQNNSMDSNDESMDPITMVQVNLEEDKNRPLMPLSGGDDNQSENGSFAGGNAMDATDSKRTLFKCKKCNFRDSDRNVVLAHVKGHYPENMSPTNAAYMSNLLSSTNLLAALFAAGNPQNSPAAAAALAAALPNGFEGLVKLARQADEISINAASTNNNNNNKTTHNNNNNNDHGERVQDNLDEVNRDHQNVIEASPMIVDDDGDGDSLINQTTMGTNIPVKPVSSSTSSSQIGAIPSTSSSCNQTPIKTTDSTVIDCDVDYNDGDDDDSDSVIDITASSSSKHGAITNNTNILANKLYTNQSNHNGNPTVSNIAPTTNKNNLGGVMVKSISGDNQTGGVSSQSMLTSFLGAAPKPISPMAGPSSLYAAASPITNHKYQQQRNSNGELYEMANMSSGSQVTVSPLPYRCAHCHQLSNWKHVIQRHCRLKHNGEVRIETIDKLTNLYQPLVAATASHPPQQQQQQQQQNHMQHHQQQQANKSQSPPPALTTGDKLSQLLQHQPSSHQPTSTSTPNMMFPITLNTFNNNDESNSNSSDNPQFIKDEPECQLQESDQILDLRKQDKTLYFCPYCPTRYFGRDSIQTHLKTHSSFAPYRCQLCSYSARQESFLVTHTAVHSQLYHEKTEEMKKRNIISTEFAPQENRKVEKDGVCRWVLKSPLQPNADTTSRQGMAASTSSSNKATVDSSKKKLDLQMERLKEMQQQQQQQQHQQQMNNSGGSVKEKCPNCPFGAADVVELRQHIQKHISVSAVESMYTCDHCDFSCAVQQELSEHVLLHFAAMHKGTAGDGLQFYTYYNQLELNATLRTVYSEATADDDYSQSGGIQDRVVVDTKTGNVLQ